MVLAGSQAVGKTSCTPKYKVLKEHKHEFEGGRGRVMSGSQLSQLSQPRAGAGSALQASKPPPIDEICRREVKSSEFNLHFLVLQLTVLFLSFDGTLAPAAPSTIHYYSSEQPYAQTMHRSPPSKRHPCVHEVGR